MARSTLKREIKKLETQLRKVREQLYHLTGASFISADYRRETSQTFKLALEKLDENAYEVMQMCSQLEHTL